MNTELGSVPMTFKALFFGALSASLILQTVPSIAQDWRILDAGDVVMAVVSSDSGSSLAVTCFKGENVGFGFSVTKSTISDVPHPGAMHLSIDAIVGGTRTNFVANTGGTESDDAWTYNLDQQQRGRAARDLAEASTASAGLIENLGDTPTEVFEFAVDSNAVKKVLDGCGEQSTTLPKSLDQDLSLINAEDGVWQFAGPAQPEGPYAAVTAPGSRLKFTCAGGGPIRMEISVDDATLDEGLRTTQLSLVIDNRGEPVGNAMANRIDLGERSLFSYDGASELAKAASGAGFSIWVTLGTRKAYTFAAKGSTKAIRALQDAC